MGTWTVIIICSLIAFGYALISDYLDYSKKSKTDSELKFSLNGLKYLAILSCVLLAALATLISMNQITWFGFKANYVGAPVLALILSILVYNLTPDDSNFMKGFKKGTSFSAKKYLSLGIVFLGGTLVLTDLAKSLPALPLVLFNMALAFGVSWFIGTKIFKLSINTSNLIGSGTCICGGSAIAAVSPIIRAKEEETGYALAAIFFFDLLACLVYPYLADALNMTATQFGYLAGTAINDTSSVIAAQETFAGLKDLIGYGLPATIKVVRTSMIIVLALVFTVIMIKRDAQAVQTEGGETQTTGSTNIGAIVWKALPKFILVFIGVVIVNTIVKNVDTLATADWYAKVVSPICGTGCKFFFTIALAGVGFKLKFKDIFTKGAKPIAVGGLTWFALFISSLIFALLFVPMLGL